MPYEATAVTPTVTALSLASERDLPSSAKAMLMALLSLRDGAMNMRLPDGRSFRFGDAHGPQTEIHVRDLKLAARVLHKGDIGFADSFIAGEWDSPDLAGLLTLLADNAERINKVFFGNPLARLGLALSNLARANTRAGSRRNIHAHYDLGNDFYAAWLDPGMTYSAAMFTPMARHMEAAQRVKYHALAQRLQLRRGDRVLEIGCGWGGFAEIAAAEYGAQVTAVTISAAQHAYARERIGRAGLADRATIELRDYRDLTGSYDKIASIEMFEAVGERYWPAFCAKLAALLAPGGRAALQVITIRDDLFDSYRRRVDFVQRCVFPGGMLASRERLAGQLTQAGLDWREDVAFGDDYARTLALWAERFEAQWDVVRALGFDDRFRRLWRFYLAYCEAGFRAGRTDVLQITLAKA